jgi:hypothetical protein
VTLPISLSPSLLAASSTRRTPGSFDIRLQDSFSRPDEHRRDGDLD